MYSRYKNRKNSFGFLKILITAAVLMTAVFFMYQYRSKLMFWKYTTMTMREKFDKISSIQDQAVKADELSKLSEKINNYCSGNQTDKDAYLLKARASFLSGEIKNGRNFEKMLIESDFSRVGDQAYGEFMQTIKYINKSTALDDQQKLSDDDILLFAKACFYTKYYSNKDINVLLTQIREPSKIRDVSDIRFYALMKILNDEAEKGIGILNKKGSIKTIEDKLFLAGACTIAKQYTNAIVLYKESISEIKDPLIRAKVIYNLGKIYYTQSLFNEAIEQLEKIAVGETSSKEILVLLLESYKKIGYTEKVDQLSKQLSSL